ncbi:hypothetical protein J4439_04335 [Candidatus Woesearchaeota archaeon]|nr:hypothetical protein [Candidatus Woesearchaeota archaeon]
MATLEELRAKRMAELQRQQVGEDFQQEMALQQQVAQLEAIAKQFLSREALVRYGTIRTAHPEAALQAAMVVARLGQGGKVKELSDEHFKEILKQITPKKREIKISRM